MDVALVNSHILYKVATQRKITQLDFRLSVAKSLTEELERLTTATIPLHQNFPSASKKGPSLNPCQMERGQTAKSVVYVEQGNDIKRGIDASFVIHPCVYTPALSGTVSTMPLRRTAVSSQNVWLNCYFRLVFVILCGSYPYPLLLIYI